MGDGFDNTNKGVLFKNTEKETDKHPDYRGQLDVNGEKFWLSAWINTSKAGNKYMSLAIKLKNSDSAQPKKSRADDLNDQIPF